MPKWFKAMCDEQISEVGSEPHPSQKVQVSRKNSLSVRDVQGSGQINPSAEDTTNESALRSARKTRSREIVLPVRYRNQLRGADE